MQDGVAGEIDALVVGAGPVGLVMAIELRRSGLAVRVVDQAAEPSAHSKAQVIHPRSLELLDHAGVAGRLVDRGRWVQGVSLWSTEPRRTAHLVLHAVDSPFEHILSLPQRDTEQILAAHLAWLGVEVERGTTLVGLRQDEAGVEATLRRGGSDEVARVPWLLGCDGAHSAVRKALAVAFEGESYELRVLQADVRVDWGAPLPEDELCVFVGERGALAAFPLPGEGRYRVVVPLDAADAAEATLDAIQQALRERGPAGAKASDPAWVVDFRLHRRLAERFRVGRVFLAGDAAHIHSPAGGQGMNNGIHDACNLAWKLALVQRGAAHVELLDSYEAERRPVAAAALAATDAATRGALGAFAMRSPLLAPLRASVLGLLSGLDVVQHRVSRLITMLEIGYPESPVVAQDRPPVWSASVLGDKASEEPTVRDWFDFGHGPVPGERAPDVVIEERSGLRLFDLLRGHHHALLLFDGAAATEQGYKNLDAIAAWVSERLGDHVRPFVVVPRAARPEGLRWQGVVVIDASGALHRRYGARSECLYLLRPDGHVAYRSQPASLDRLQAFARRVFVVGEGALDPPAGGR